MFLILDVRSLIISVRITKCTECPFYDEKGPSLIPTKKKVEEFKKEHGSDNIDISLYTSWCAGPWCYFGDHMMEDHNPETGIPEWCGLYLNQWINRHPIDISGIKKIRLDKAKWEK